MLNQELFTMFFESLASRFPKTTLTDHAYELYYSLLSRDLDDYQFTIAIENLFRDCEFFPSPKQIIEAAPSLNGLLRSEMIRLDIYCNLPEEWQFNGARTVAELPQDKQREYLAHLKTIKAAIAPLKQ
jgi:hypothetical protein